MSLPLVSCICPTYNRPPTHQHLAEEAIESFLRQDYPNKELIVLNDTPGQELYCDAKGVVVVNVPRRFRTLGEKRNAAVGMSHGELITLWDDDDISLPWRLTYSVERLGDKDYFAPRKYWVLSKDRLLHDYRLNHSHPCSIYTRAAFDANRGYPFISLGDDTVMDRVLSADRERAVDPMKGAERVPRADWFYIYRRGVSPEHVSAGGDQKVGRYISIGERPITEGSFYLHPHWQRDYGELIAWGLAHPEETCERCDDEELQATRR